MEADIVCLHFCSVTIADSLWCTVRVVRPPTRVCRIPDRLVLGTRCHRHSVPFKFCASFVLLFRKAYAMKGSGNENIVHMEVRSHPGYGIVIQPQSSFGQCMFSYSKWHGKHEEQT